MTILKDLIRCVEISQPTARIHAGVRVGSHCLRRRKPQGIDPDSAAAGGHDTYPNIATVKVRAPVQHSIEVDDGSCFMSSVGEVGMFVGKCPNLRMPELAIDRTWCRHAGDLCLDGINWYMAGLFGPLLAAGSGNDSNLNVLRLDSLHVIYPRCPSVWDQGQNSDPWAAVTRDPRMDWSLMIQFILPATLLPVCAAPTMRYLRRAEILLSEVSSKASASEKAQHEAFQRDRVAEFLEQLPSGIELRSISLLLYCPSLLRWSAVLSRLGVATREVVVASNLSNMGLEYLPRGILQGYWSSPLRKAQIVDLCRAAPYLEDLTLEMASPNGSFPWESLSTVALHSPRLRRLTVLLKVEEPEEEEKRGEEQARRCLPTLDKTAVRDIFNLLVAQDAEGLWWLKLQDHACTSTRGDPSRPGASFL
ncbi:hypothetical protein V8F06_014721 [Rhypophila decipiens]